MEVKIQPSLRFLGVNFTKVNFQSKKPFPSDGSQMVELLIQPSISYPKKTKMNFQIIMEVNLFAKENFEFTCLATGEFLFSGKLSAAQKQSFINANAPAIMFPYVRAFISTFTAVLGKEVTGCIVIPTHFFKGELKEVKTSK